MSELIPLTVLEKFLFWEDRPSYPWCAFCKYEFEGTLDKHAFQKAATDALRRHVLLRSKLLDRRGKLYWVPTADVETPIEWIEPPADGVFPRLKRIDLGKEIGLQLAASTHGGKTDLIFGGHHACADALGGASFARDVFINYANLTSDSQRQTRLPNLDFGSIENRGRFGMNWREFVKQLPMQIVGLAGARQFVKRQPVPLIPHQAAAGSELPPEYPQVITAELDRDTTRSLRECCRLKNLTLNDLLARDLFLAVNHWRGKRKLDQSEWIRMMVPMNVRTRNTRDLPATNFVSSVFLDRRGRDFNDAESLLRSIAAEMRLIKDNNLGMTFLFSLKLLNLIPGQLKRAASNDRCSSSFIFSNLDRHFLRLPFPKNDGKLIVGNLVLNRAWTVAPLRPYSLASFMSLVYSGRLLLTLHHDGRFIDVEAANDLIQIWLQHLINSSRSSEQ